MSFKERIVLVGIILLAIPTLFIAYLIFFCLFPLTLLDIPIWIVTGKHPISNLVAKINEELP